MGFEHERHRRGDGRICERHHLWKNKTAAQQLLLHLATPSNKLPKTQRAKKRPVLVSTNPTIATSRTAPCTDHNCQQHYGSSKKARKIHTYIYTRPKIAHHLQPSFAKRNAKSENTCHSRLHVSTPSTFLKNSLTLPTSTASPPSLSTAAVSPSNMASTLPSSSPVHRLTTLLYAPSSSELRPLSAATRDCSFRLLDVYAASWARSTAQEGRDARYVFWASVGGVVAASPSKAGSITFSSVWIVLLVS